MTAPPLRRAALVAVLAAVPAVSAAAAPPTPNVISVVRMTGDRSDLLTMSETGATRFVRSSDRGRRIVSADWSPDGRRIALFQENRSKPGGGDVFVAPSGGGPTRRITTGDTAFLPGWSPDGTTLLYGRSVSVETNVDTGVISTNGTGVWLVSPGAGAPRPIHPPVNLVVEQPWSWTPDGRSVGVTRCVVRDGNGPRLDDCEAGFSDLGTGAFTSVAKGFLPEMSPDGRRIAFFSQMDRNGTVAFGGRRVFATELYVVNADGTGLTRLTRTRGVIEGAPRFSPDGARILFARTRSTEVGAGTSVWQINTDGSCPRRIAAARGGRDPVSWEYADWLPLTGRRKGLGPIAC